MRVCLSRLEDQVRVGNSLGIYVHTLLILALMLLHTTNEKNERIRYSVYPLILWCSGRKYFKCAKTSMWVSFHLEEFRGTVNYSTFVNNRATLGVLVPAGFPIRMRYLLRANIAKVCSAHFSNIIVRFWKIKEAVYL